MNPNYIAVVYEENSLTYEELDEKVVKLAFYLKANGVKKGEHIGICVNRTYDLVIALLSVMKLGATYIPLDPEFPQQRLSYMIEDSQCKYIITHQEVIEQTANVSNASFLVLDREWKDIEQTYIEKKDQITLEKVGAYSLAYILYTSGSTGKPKGVMIPHTALTNFVLSMEKQLGMKQKDILLAVNTYCFDIAGLELFLPLITGAKCHICSQNKVRNIELLKKEIEKVSPDFMQATPITWKMLYKIGWNNKEKIKIICGGEALSEQLKQSFIESGSEAFNMYGPTETTIWSTMKKITEEKVTIGRPIDNTQIYILDENLNLVPEGVYGELCIAGDGVGLGYYNKEELTKEKFVRNPFEGNTTLYKTGDYARWLQNGEIDLKGRMDQQVKIFYQNQLNKVAQFWINGKDIDWSLYYDGVRKRVPLPSYVFEKEKYYIKSNTMKKDTQEKESISRRKQKCNKDRMVVEAIANVLGIKAEKFNYKKTLSEYGLNSLLSIKLLKDIQEVYPNCSLEELKATNTIDDVIRNIKIKSFKNNQNLNTQNKNNQIKNIQNKNTNNVLLCENNQEEFPELIKLNHETKGRSIFWIHAASGGVETFANVAKELNRPFYGIQARGYMSDKSPIKGIKNIAQYYIRMIRSIQPEGPYDLGGYCLGGVIVYEMARQLQIQNQDINTIVMIDSPDMVSLQRASKSNESNKVNKSNESDKSINTFLKTAELQLINMMLWPKDAINIKEILPHLIHQDEISKKLDHKSFCKKLVKISKKKGLNINKKQLYTLLNQNNKMQYNYRISKYHIKSLPHNEFTKCYYFRNGSALFYGDLEAFMTIKGNKLELDYVQYWKEWERQFSKFEIIDVESPNHMMMLTDLHSRKKICSICSEIYSRK